MNGLLVFTLLGQSDRAERFVNAFREGNPTFPVYQLWPVATVVLVIAVSFTLFLWFPVIRSRLGACSDRKLFHELCRLHRLDASHVRALEKLIRSEKLAHSPAVFLRPDLFCTGDVVLGTNRQSLALAHVRNKIFGA